MTTSDYGPVPMAQFKERTSEVYNALDQGRRVLLSRHGRVIAAIDPASVARHARLLATYAMHDSAVAELSPRTIGQGSPARVIRTVQAGAQAVVTRDSKVYGVISMLPVAQTTALGAAREEEQLAAFEREHPDASPEEFAEFSESLTGEGSASSEVSTALRDMSDVYGVWSGTSFAAPYVARLVAEAMHVKGIALEKTNDHPAAEEALQSAIQSLDRLPIPDADSRAKAAELLVELSKVYVADDRPADAVSVADEAVRRILGLGAGT